MRKARYEIDMTRGPLFGKLISFSVPLMLTGILQLLYNAADMVVVGKYNGTDITLDKVDYKFVKQDDVLAVVTD